MLETRKASILLYTLFVTTFMIAFFAAFQNDIRSMLMRSGDKAEWFLSRLELADAHNLLEAGQAASLKSQYSIQKMGQDDTGISYLIGSGQILNIPVRVSSIGAIEFTAETGSAPVDISYTGSTFSSGFALSGGESIFLSTITQSGNLSMTSLGGISKISAKFSSAEIVWDDGLYSLSRKSGKIQEVLGTFYIKK